ncbi:MAG: PfkB family carbohydrate kinase, partial [Ruthenibacterium sp.]
MVYRVDHIAVGGETILSQSLYKYWGGKGLNQAIALARSYDEVYMAGMINHEDASLRTFMAENNLHDDYLTYSQQPTGHAIICVDKKGQNSITVFGGANQDLTEEYVNSTLEHFQAGDIVLVQNETNALEAVLRTAHARGLRIAMNPSPFADDLLKLPLEDVDLFLI